MLSDLSLQDFNERAHGNWRKRFKIAGWKDMSYLDAYWYCQQVRPRIETAVKCVESNRHKRPSIEDIISTLNGREAVIDKLLIPCPLLVVNPLRLCFPFEADELIPCPLHLTNNTDLPVAFTIRPKATDAFVGSLEGIVRAKSSLTFVLTLVKQKQAPPNLDRIAPSSMGAAESARLGTEAAPDTGDAGGKEQGRHPAPRRGMLVRERAAPAGEVMGNCRSPLKPRGQSPGSGSNAAVLTDDAAEKNQQEEIDMKAEKNARSGWEMGTGPDPITLWDSEKEVYSPCHVVQFDPMLEEAEMAWNHPDSAAANEEEWAIDKQVTQEEHESQMTGSQQLNLEQFLSVITTQLQQPLLETPKANTQSQKQRNQEINTERRSTRIAAKLKENKTVEEMAMEQVAKKAGWLTPEKKLDVKAKAKYAKMFGKPMNETQAKAIADLVKIGGSQPCRANTKSTGKAGGTTKST
ncbi:hypothetical protein ACP70R_003150 [Stipagrostis hirtigluma subsp. patula]